MFVLCRPISRFAIQYMWLTCNWKHCVDLLICLCEKHFQFSFNISSTSSESFSRFPSASLDTTTAHKFSRLSHPSHYIVVRFCCWREAEEFKTKLGSHFQLLSPAKVILPVGGKQEQQSHPSLQPDQENWATRQFGWAWGGGLQGDGGRDIWQGLWRGRGQDYYRRSQRVCGGLKVSTKGFRKSESWVKWRGISLSCRRGHPINLLSIYWI